MIPVILLFEVAAGIIMICLGMFVPLAMMLLGQAIGCWLWLAVGSYLDLSPKPKFFRWIFCLPDPWGLKGQAINARKLK